MRNASAADVIAEVRKAPYAALFRHVFGRTSLHDVDEAYDDVARAIAAYESSRWVNTFTSRFDAYMAGKRNALTAQQERGLELFNGKGMCSQCHPSAPGPYSTGRAEGKALFTDYTYDNLGIPKNPAFALPPLGFDPNAVDLGLGGFLRGTGDRSTWPPPTRRTARSRSPRCATSPARPPTATTATSRRSRRSSTSTTRATSPKPAGRRRRSAVNVNDRGTRRPGPHRGRGGRPRGLPARAERSGGRADRGPLSARHPDR